MSFVGEFREALAQFLEAPARDNLRVVLQHHDGEQNWCDFKETLPEYPKLARHILALANSGGGLLVIGVREEEDGSLTPVGVQAFTDKGDIEKSIRRYLPAALDVYIGDFSYESAEYAKIQGNKFQVIAVQDKPEKLPFVCKDNSNGIRGGAIYVRHGTNSEEANSDDLDRVIGRRLAVSTRAGSELSLKEHLGQLKTLYDEIPRSIAKPGHESAFSRMVRTAFNPLGILDTPKEPNPNYPHEDYQAFIKRMVIAKKSRIEEFLEISK